ncbi:hypothetical protein GW17_00007754 [Ensete ventricosum]|nr:hypothetical protein GW17_00007754 [Ensete ventricosum]
MVDFGRRRPIEEEIDRRRSIEEEKGKKKKKRKKKKEGKKEYLARTSSSPACCRRPRVACALSPPAGRLRPRPLFLPREERERLPARGERSRRHVMVEKSTKIAGTPKGKRASAPYSNAIAQTAPSKIEETIIAGKNMEDRRGETAMEVDPVEDL